MTWSDDDGTAGRRANLSAPRTACGSASRPARLPARQLITPVVDRDLLAALQLSRSYPSVSVLLATTPAPILGDDDASRLASLLERARRRLLTERPARQVHGLMDRLQHLAAIAAGMPATSGLALFASEDQALGVQLPVPVVDRVVVDPTFATRDLVRALEHRLRYRLLALSAREARLFEGWPGQLAEVRAGAFPVPAAQPPDRQDRSRRFGRERSRDRDARTIAHLRAVDAALALRQARDPLPLVIAGVGRHLGFCRDLPAMSSNLVGTITGNHDHHPPARLAALSRPVIDAHRQRLQADALTRLLEAPDPARRVEGIDAVWLAAVEGRISLLCVEQSYVFPARTTHEGHHLRAATDVEHPDVLDDAVDELIELVAAQEGTTAVVDDGVLRDHRHLAALLRDA